MKTKGTCLPPEPSRDEDPVAASDLVREAVASALTEKQREAVELFFFEGETQSEIARRLGVSQQVVQKRIFGVQRGGVTVGGAIAKLREALLPHAESLGLAP